MSIIWELLKNMWKKDIFFRRMIVGFILIGFIWIVMMVMGLTEESTNNKNNIIVNNDIENYLNINEFNLM